MKKSLNRAAGALVAVALLLGLAGAAAADDIRTITLTGTDDMQWDVTRIEAKPGERIRVVQKTISRMAKTAMAHNFVLLKKDTDVQRFVTLASMARRTDYIPPQMEDQILAKTGLAGGGETVEVTFTAPAEKGEYPYVCTFPGHYAAGMNGVLVVK